MCGGGDLHSVLPLDTLCSTVVQGPSRTVGKVSLQVVVVRGEDVLYAKSRHNCRCIVVGSGCNSSATGCVNLKGVVVIIHVGEPHRTLARPAALDRRPPGAATAVARLVYGDAPPDQHRRTGRPTLWAASQAPRAEQDAQGPTDEDDKDPTHNWSSTDATEHL